MKEHSNNDFYLAKWISGDLSDADLKVLVTPKAYASFLAIRDSLIHMKSPTPPNFELAYQQLHGKIIHTGCPVMKEPIKITRWISIAACLLVLLALGSYQGGLFGYTEYATTTESKKIFFTDNVWVTLHPNTRIKQKAPLVNTESIYLEKGKAYFEVEKGTHFSIRTSHGNVEVLGTKFTVKVHNDLFEVQCFEGKVKVDYNDSIYYVGEGTHFNAKLKEVNPLGFEPDGLLNYKHFNATNLGYIFDFIENTYNVNLDYPNRLTGYKFTGTIPMDNLEDALSLVCYSFNLNFELHDRNVIIKN